MIATAHHIALINFLKSKGAREQVMLAPYSTLKVGGPARFFITPNTPLEIIEIQRASIEYGLPIHILSGGSNTLFSDQGFLGIVLKLGPAFDSIKSNVDGHSFTIGAATSFAKVTKMALYKGFSLATGWGGIPGLMGGAVRMNAGTRLSEIGDAVLAVRGILHESYTEFTKSKIHFEYRKNDLPQDLIITDVELFFDPYLTKPVAELLLIAQEYRLKRKQTQPTINSLGSFFKNPYPAFAAQLIEKCNLKGLQYKSAQISPLHANFIINNGGASANDILYIASVAQKRVFEQYGIRLCPEAKLVGEFLPDYQLWTESVEFKPNDS